MCIYIYVCGADGHISRHSTEKKWRKGEFDDPNWDLLSFSSLDEWLLYQWVQNQSLVFMTNIGFTPLLTVQPRIFLLNLWVVEVHFAYPQVFFLIRISLYSCNFCFSWYILLLNWKLFISNIVYCSQLIILCFSFL